VAGGAPPTALFLSTRPRYSGMKTRGDKLAVRGVRIDEAALDAIFDDVDQAHEPGVAVGISVAGVPVYRKGFGLANMELPVALGPSMRMRVYSVSKHITCLCYLLLCEEGRAGLDDPVGVHLPELHPSARRATMRQLMGNTSGLRDVHDVNWVFSGFGRHVESEALLAAYRDIADTNFPAGTAWAYNNGGFLLLTAVIERLEQSSLEIVLRRRIFGPVGMADTMLRRFDNDFVPNSATMHMVAPGGGFDRSYLGAAMAGEGGIVSTVDDMLRWMAHMDAPVIGSPETWEALRRPATLANGQSTHYGLALATGDHRGAATLFHSGGGFGAHSQMLKVPDAGLDLVVLTNRYDKVAADYGNRILDCCLTGLTAAPPRSKSAVEGVFYSKSTGRVVQLFLREDAQMAWIDNDMVMESDEDGTLRPSGKFMLIRQTIRTFGPRERPSAIELDDFGNVDHLDRAADEPRADPGSIIGVYEASSVGVTAVIARGDTGLVFATRSRFGKTEAQLEPLARGLWRTRLRWPWMGAGIAFDEDGGSFRLSTARTRSLRFVRLPDAAVRRQ